MPQSSPRLYRTSITSFTFGGLAGALVVASVPWLILQRGYSTTLAAWLVATPSLGLVAVALLSHRYIDRIPLRMSLFAGFFIQMVGLTAMILSEITGQYTIGASFLLLLSIGISGQLVTNSTYTQVTAITNGQKSPLLLRQRHSLINTIAQLMAFGGGVVGVALSGFLSLTVIASVAVVCSGLGLTLAYRLPEQARVPLDANHQYGLWDALTVPSMLRTLLFVGIVWNIGVTFYAGLQSAWLYEAIKASTGQASIFFTCSAMGTIVSGIFLNKSHYSNKSLLAGGYALQGGSIVGLALTHNIWVACGLIFVCMFANTTIASVLLNTRIIYAQASGVSSVLNTSILYNRLAGMITAVVVGAIISFTVYWILFVIAAISLLSIAVFVSRLPLQTTAADSD